MPQLSDFSGVWAVDFEFAEDVNGHPKPVCMVGKELLSGFEGRWWGPDLWKRRASPIPTSPDHIFLAYAANAECSCYLALNWPLPQTILDLYVEYRHLQNNGVKDARKYGLVDALRFYNLASLGDEEKTEMRSLALRYFPYTRAEQQALLDYCASDVYSLCRLLPTMLPNINLGQALLRGRYMAAVARMEWTGIPVDIDLFTEVMHKWEALRGHLINEVDRYYHVFHQGHFSSIRWLEWCRQQGIDWPLTPKACRAELKGETFRGMAEHDDRLQPMAELRATLDQLKRNELFGSLKADGYLRSWPKPFSAKTGRNAPSSKTDILLGPAWLRWLLQAQPDYGLVNIDFVGQEIGVVAALSGDQALMTAYQSGDPHTYFGRSIGLIPSDGTAQTHAKARDLCKTLLFGTNYGMGAKKFAQKARLTLPQAQEYIRQHRLLFGRYWRWIEQEIEEAYTQGYMETVFGWRHQQVFPSRIKRGELIGVKRTTLQDFPAQANGGEILRLALCWLTEQGFQVCASVHDSVLLLVPIASHQEDIARARYLMAKAGEAVLDGFTLWTEAEWFPYPEHVSDKKGDRLWRIISSRLPEINSIGSTAGWVQGAGKRA